MAKEKKSKSKKEKSDENASTSQVDGDQEKGLSYEEKLRHVSIIAKPMAPRKLTKKLYKVIRKASKHKKFLRNGLKDVQNRIKKGDKGIVIFAGDVTPIEIMCHLPAVCEETDIPYVYTPSREDLGTAIGVKRSSLMVMVIKNEEYEELYNDCVAEIQALPLPIEFL